MAKEIGDLIVRLSLDSAKFDDGIKRLESQMTKVQASFRSSATGITDFDKVTAKLQASAQTLTERLSLQKDKVAQLEKAYEESKRTKGEDAEETQKLAAKLEEARGKMNQTQQALDAVNQQIKLNQNGWYQLGVNLENVGAKLEAVGKKISSVGSQMSMKVTAPIVALGTAAVKTFTDFDDSMRTVQATMVASDEDLAKLTATAKEMGATTRFTASESAQALNYLALAGYDADQAIEALPKVLNLAAAGGLDLAYASDLVTDSMSALGLEMDELTGFTDEMAKTAQKSNTNIAQLGEGILTVGGTAKILKGGTVELNTALGILADNGMKGSEGGTKLRNMILSLTAPTEKSALLMEKLGLKVFDAEGKMRPLNEVFKDLDGIMAGMTDEEKQNVLNNIFNKTDLKAAEAMLANCGDRFDELSGYIGDCDGAAQQMADTMEGGIGGSFRAMKSAVEGLAIAFGERLAPYIKAAADKITEITRKLTEMNPKTLDLIIKIAAIAAAIGPVLVIVGKVTTGVGTFMKVLAPLAKLLGGAQASTGALGAAFTALTGPVGIVIGVIAGLAAIFVTLYKTNDEFREKVQAAWAQICAAFEKAKEVFAATWEKFKAGLEPVKEALQKLWETVQAVFKQIWDLIEPVVVAIGAVLGGLVTVVMGVANGILNALAPLMEAIVNAVDVVTNIIGAIVALLNGDFSGAWEFAKNAVSSFGAFFENIFTAIGNFFSGFWEMVCSVASTFGINLGEVFSGIWTSIRDGVTTAWTGIKSWLSESWASIKGIASTAWTGICEAVSSVVNTGKAWISTAWENVKTTVGEKWDALKTSASTAWQNICTNAKNAVDNAKAGIQSAWTTISTGISNGWNTFKSTASTAWSNITSGVQSTIANAKNGIVTAWDNIKAGVKSTWDGITNIFKAPIDAVSSWLTEKVNWFKGLFNFTWKLPEFKLPKINVSWNDIGFGIKLPKLSVSWNALGGIFDRPTIFATAAGLQGVGEAGPEAVLPLNTLWDEMSTRLKSGMMDILRDANLSDAGQVGATVRDAIREEMRMLLGGREQGGDEAKGDTVLNLQVDGKTFARLILPYVDKEQASAWERNLRLSGV